MSSFSRPLALPALALASVLAATRSEATEACAAAGPARNLPGVARESSGLAHGRERPGMLWTHNDRGNASEIFAVDSEGRLVQTVGLSVPAIDWEDIEIAPCVAGSCLFIADIGDNDSLRDHIAIHRLPEPSEGALEATDVVTLRARYPDGPRDAEALFVLPSGDLFIVTKGRNTDIALYRLPESHTFEGIATLERVREIFPVPANGDDRVSAATASHDGTRVAIRTYRQLYVYDAAELVSGAPLNPMVIDLGPLGEGQGEGVALADDGTVWLSSEAANRRSFPVLNRLQCSFTDGDRA
jgi:hypothetical protein